MNTDELDFATFNYTPAIPANNKELLANFDNTVEKAIAALENAKDEDFGKTWRMRKGDHVYFEMPKAAVVRTFALNHMIHHRGQLSVYLRLNGVAVPGVYGPSADEKPAPIQEAFAEAAAN